MVYVWTMNTISYFQSVFLFIFVKALGKFSLPKSKNKEKLIKEIREKLKVMDVKIFS